MTAQQYIEWLDEKIGWCNQMLLAKEENGGVTTREVNGCKSTLMLVKEKFLTIDFPSQPIEDTRDFTEGLT